MRSKNVSTAQKIAIIVMLGIFLHGLVFAAMLSRVTITFSGTIAKRIFAQSGSVSDINTAINQAIAAGGAEIVIPEGDWLIGKVDAFVINLASLPSGAWLNITGSYRNVTAITNFGVTKSMPATILRSSNAGQGFMFYVTGSAGKHVRFSGLSILGKTTDNSDDSGIGLELVDGFRIDHCYIDSHCNADILAWKSKGLVDHNTIDQTYASPTVLDAAWGYGVQVAGDQPASYGTWHYIPDISEFLGQYDSVPYYRGLVYIEDNVFNLCRHAVTSSQGGFYVARHNLSTLDRFQAYDVHGCGFLAGYGAEIYDNIMLNPHPNGAQAGITLRGGRNVVYNNTFGNGFNVDIYLNADDWLGNSVGIDDPQNVHETGIWNNTFGTSNHKLYDLYGYRQGVDFWTDLPPSSNIGSYLYANYTPFQYPHPLASG